jgi:hypothetical protein
MKMLEIRHKTSVLRYRPEWLTAMEVEPKKASKANPNQALLYITISAPEVFWSGMTSEQIGKLKLGKNMSFEFATVDEALAAVSIIEI